jgi:uncharacterized tellurite resistance protein B-like protein
MQTNIYYQQGLLHFAHLLANVDGHIDEREKEVLLTIKKEEQIPDSLFQSFMKTAEGCNEYEMYCNGIDLLNQCTDEEKLAAFVQLYRLAESDDSVHAKEVRLLMYGVKGLRINFDDVVLSAQLAGYNKGEFGKNMRSRI